MVYENYKIYGPYLNKKDNRLRSILVSPDNKKLTISYPKYLMEVHLDRYLEDDETVHHIDGNPLNNDIKNLQVIKRSEHVSNDVMRNSDVTVKCKYCGKEFIIKGSTINNRNRSDREFHGYFCSKKCSGKYGRSIQLGLIKHTTEDKVVPDKRKRRG